MVNLMVPELVRDSHYVYIPHIPLFVFPLLIVADTQFKGCLTCIDCWEFTKSVRN